MRSLLPCSIAIALLSTGCTDPVVQFRPNAVHATAVSLSRDVPAADVGLVVADRLEPVFGTPQHPLVPEAMLRGDLVTLDNVSRAAGQIASDAQDRHRGLFREHCVRCHGVGGDGVGAAARWQWPYPRDFRAGIFKYKSTPRADRPTRGDLRATLIDGLPGSAMPTFATLAQEDLEALVDYVIYLSVRGETERRLIDMAVDEFGYPDEPLGPSFNDEIASVVQNIVDRWAAAEPTVVPPRVDDGRPIAERVAAGKAIFHGPIANCVGCHGPGGAGGVPTLDYDEWTKMHTTAVGLSPTDRDDRRTLIALGALPPRTIKPRHLAGGVARGGTDPQRLYRLIQNGIAGTPMPAVAIAGDQPGRALSEAEAWDLVDYVQSQLQ